MHEHAQVRPRQVGVFELVGLAVSPISANCSIKPEARQLKQSKTMERMQTLAAVTYINVDFSLNGVTLRHGQRIAVRKRVLQQAVLATHVPMQRTRASNLCMYLE